MTLCKTPHLQESSQIVAWRPISQKTTSRGLAWRSMWRWVKESPMVPATNEIKETIRWGDICNRYSSVFFFWVRKIILVSLVDILGHYYYKKHVAWPLTWLLPWKASVNDKELANSKTSEEWLSLALHWSHNYNPLCRLQVTEYLISELHARVAWPLLASAAWQLVVWRGSL